MNKEEKKVMIDSLTLSINGMVGTPQFIDACYNLRRKLEAGTK